MNVRIVVDSSADMTDDVRERLTIVPLSVIFGDTEYKTMSHKEFYERLIESDVLPTTSQASPDTFRQLYEEAAAVGESLIVITISSKFSGTYQSAVIAAEDFKDTVYVVDSKAATISHGILAELALRLADEGLDAASIAKRLEIERDNIYLVALVDTLEYLQRGGRISKTAAFTGGLLSIKPVLGLYDGEIAILGKARGSRQGNNLLVKEIEKAGGVDFDKPLLLGYTGLSDFLLNKYVEDSAALWKDRVSELPRTCVGSIVGTHAGPGAIAVAFYSKRGSKE